MACDSDAAYRRGGDGLRFFSCAAFGSRKAASNIACAAQRQISTDCPGLHSELKS
jgi:hypothetical protein